MISESLLLEFGARKFHVKKVQTSFKCLNFLINLYNQKIVNLF